MFLCVTMLQCYNVTYVNSALTSDISSLESEMDN